MVRAGVVKHPREWEWCGYHELVGRRRRYRLVSMDGLLKSLGGMDLAAFRRSYEERIDDEAARRGGGMYEPQWSESLAVGSFEFVDSMRKHYRRRVKFQIDPVS